MHSALAKQGADGEERLWRGRFNRQSDIDRGAISEPDVISRNGWEWFKRRTQKDLFQRG